MRVEVWSETGGKGRGAGRWLAGLTSCIPCSQVLLLGLDSAGKSTLLKRLKHDTGLEPPLPTIGYDVEEFEHADVVYSLYDVGGQRQSRAHWQQLLSSGAQWSQSGDGVGGVIFVVDSADPSRWSEAREELHNLLHDRRLQDTPLLVLANKLDLPSAKSEEAVAEALHIGPGSSLPESTRCVVRGASTLEGHGVLAALEWIAAHSPSEHHRGSQG